MCKFGMVLLFLLPTGNDYAQNFFVLIQSDHRQPFYVRLGGQLYSSSPDGHLLLGQLKDSTYTITVGFPRQTNAAAGGLEQTFSLATRRTDQELQLKDQGEAGWGLYDPRRKEWLAVLARSGGRGEFHAVGVRRDDAFSRMMAGVVQDTAVLYNNFTDSALLAAGTDPAAGSNPVSPSPVTASPAAFSPPAAIPAATVKPDTTARNPTVANAPRPDTATLHYRPSAGTTLHKSPPVTDSSARLPLNRPTGIVKISERRSAHTLRQVYTDRGKGPKPDTIVVIIPIDTPQPAVAGDRSTDADSPGRGTAHRLVVPAPVSPTPTSPAPTSPAPASSAADNTRARTADTGQKRPTKTALPYVNSDCHNFATDYDVDKLRVKMLDAARDEDRTAAALKVFRTKCFYTRQVRALSEVFTTDAAKYRFFETAWPFAADEHFRELVSLLTDPVYSNKFKTMTGGR